MISIILVHCEALLLFLYLSVHVSNKIHLFLRRVFPPPLRSHSYRHACPQPSYQVEGEAGQGKTANLLVYVTERVQDRQFRHSLWSPVAQRSYRRQIRREMKKKSLSSRSKRQQDLQRGEKRGEKRGELSPRRRQVMIPLCPRGFALSRYNSRPPRR